MKRYVTILFQIFPWYVYTLIHGDLDKNKKILLPEKIEGYTLSENIGKRGFPFATGIYRDPAGQEVIIKLWTGERKNIYYFNIVHQIEMTRILSAIQDRFRQKHSSPFFLARFIGASVANHQVYLIMEKVAGTSMEEMLDSNEQFRIYSECLSFLQRLSRECTREERKIISTKRAWDFIFLYPILLASAIAMHPKLSLTLLKGVPHFIVGIPALLSMEPDCLVHGDLHPDNILIAGKDTFYLIDVEHMRFCYPVYEPISTVSLKGNTEKMKELVISEIIKPTKNKKWQRAVSALMVNNITHNLTGDIAPESVRSYLHILKLAIELPQHV